MRTIKLAGQIIQLLLGLAFTSAFLPIIFLYISIIFLTTIIMTFTHYDEKTGIEELYEVEYSIEPYEPAQLYGPNENCHPESGGGIDYLLVKNVLGIDITSTLSEKERDDIEEECYQDARAYEDDFND